MKKQQDKNEKVSNRNRKTKERKKKKVGRKILIFLLIIIILGVAWFSYKTYKNGGGLSGMLATAVGHDENTKKNLKEFNVLILGVSTDIDAQLTDTIIIASYNPNTQKANLLSIPRDTFTGKNKNKATASQKINSLYNIERTPEKTLEAVNEITGLNIENYVVVKTEALRKLVDAIGGVEFNVPIDMDYDDPTQDLHIHLEAGLQKLDGEKAEQVVRFRHSNPDKNGVMTTYPSEYGSDDYGRMRTQRDFITEVLKQTLKLGNIFKIGEILEIAHENVETNMSLSYLKDYIPYAVEFNTENLQTATLPGESEKCNEIWFFMYDKLETKEIIQNMFKTGESETTDELNNNTVNNTVNVVNSTNTNSNTTITSSEKTNEEIKIELINGSGNKTKLETAKTALEDAGFKVKKTGTTSTISKTIITNKKDTTDTQLKELKQILGVGSISTNKSSTSLVDVTIVIGEDFN